MTVNSFAPMRPYCLTTEDMLKLPALKKVSSNLRIAGTAAFVLCFLVATRHGVPAEATMGLTALDNLLNDLARVAPARYNAFVDQVIPVEFQFTLMRLTGLTALLTSVFEAYVTMKARSLKAPFWRQVLSS